VVLLWSCLQADCGIAIGDFSTRVHTGKLSREEGRAGRIWRDQWTRKELAASLGVLLKLPKAREAQRAKRCYGERYNDSPQAQF
jgi:hypothetical protein